MIDYINTYKIFDSIIEERIQAHSRKQVTVLLIDEIIQILSQRNLPTQSLQNFKEEKQGSFVLTLKDKQRLVELILMIRTGFLYDVYDKYKDRNIEIEDTHYTDLVDLVSAMYYCGFFSTTL